MSIRTSAKKVAIAAVMVAPLLLTACGNDEGDTTESSTTTTKSSSATSKTSATTEGTVEETTEEVTAQETTEQAAAEPVPGDNAAAQQAAPPQNAPSEVINYDELEPVQGGQAANPQDAAAIESLIRGSLAPTTVRSMLEYVPQNTCNRVIEAAGGPAAMDFSQIPDIPLNQIPGATAGTVDSITDVQVQGDTASAWVVASANGETDSGTQRFLREDGRWKFCD